MSGKIEVYIEAGQKRVFAGALGWPGWCRSGRDEASALQALLDHAPRYATVAKAAHVPFDLPEDASALKVVQRLKGDATTDFGAPGAIPSADERPLSSEELHRLQAILKACWKALDAAGKTARGRELRKGARGGGRELDAILGHVFESEGGYFQRIGYKLPSEAGPEAAHKTILAALEEVAPLGVPEPGPRGGKRWPARYFVRRVAWHVLDHAWEIEDRAS